FHSVVPASIMEFYEYIGVERSVGSRPDVDEEAIRPLLSVKYLLNRKGEGAEKFVDEDGETLMPGYKYVKTSGGYYIYENENYVPYGFSCNYYMSYDFCDSYSKSDRASLMLKAILLTDEQIEKYGYLFDNIEDLELPPYNFDEDGTTLSLTDSSMAYDCEQLRKTSAYYFETDNYGFTAKVTRDKENLVFFSVPYDEGWTAYVNGSQVEIEKVNAGFMAVKVGAGDSEIRFEYRTPGLVYGLMITGGACVLLLLYILIFSLYRKHRLTNDYYPEGDELIKKWREQDREDALKILSERFPENVKESILDDSGDIDIPHIDTGFDGGFKIDSDILEGNDGKDEP
ncbi:MAG: YfhO family protein, partial [Acutalibacteraceae bacterium]